MQSTNVLVLGGGPAGYVTALRTAQAGIATVLVERAEPGGTCLNIGCIPSKALIHAADAFHRLAEGGDAARMGILTPTPQLDLPRLREWKQGIVSQLTGGVRALLKRAGVRVVHGEATVLDGKTVDIRLSDAEGGATQRIVCQNLVLATGSAPASLPMLPFGDKVISSTEALALSSLPSSLVVIGAGYIGLELGMAYAKLGVQVTVVEAQDRILPAWDASLTRPVQQRLQSLGVRVLLSTHLEAGDGATGTLRLRPAESATRKSGPEDSHGKDLGVPRELQAERILVAVGRRPRATEMGVGGLMLDMNGPYIRVDDQCRTSMRQVWAVGDVTGEPMLAHRATAQAEVAAAVISGQRRRFEPGAIPAVCYTDPEVAVVGLLPEQAQHQYGDTLTASFPFSNNGRALTLDAAQGFVRVVAKRDDHRIVGWQAVGPGVSELAATFTHSIEMCARLEDVAGTIHAHPTLSEAIQEAALKALGHGLHG